MACVVLVQPAAAGEPFAWLAPSGSIRGVEECVVCGVGSFSCWSGVCGEIARVFLFGRASALVSSPALARIARETYKYPPMDSD